MPTAIWHDVAKADVHDYDRRKRGFLGFFLQQPMYVIQKDYVGCGGLPHAMAYGKKMRFYNQERKGLSKCYWAFFEDLEDGLPE
jgi:hypothetical protein